MSRHLGAVADDDDLGALDQCFHVRKFTRAVAGMMEGLASEGGEEKVGKIAAPDQKSRRMAQTQQAKGGAAISAGV